MTVEAQCPAAEIVHPILSPNVADVECRIAGNLRPATKSDGKPAVCCANYTQCQIWKMHKKLLWKDRSERRQELQRRRSRHTMAGEGHEREVVRTG